MLKEDGERFEDATETASILPINTSEGWGMFLVFETASN
jgi:hypothetical protein